MKKLLELFFLLNFIWISNTFAQTTATLNVASSYKSTKILDNLPPSSFFTFDFEGNYIFLANINKQTKIAKVTPDNQTSILVDRVSQPVLGLSFNKGKVYAIFRGRITVVNHGAFTDVVTGLPAGGDYANSSVVFNDGKMYFSVGTATNSGIVGPDNAWLKKQPSLHDLPCKILKINQVSFETDNFLTAKKNDKAVTGAFMPFNTKNFSDQVAGSEKCSGSIMRANPDGSNLEMVAYGFHNPKGISFDSSGNLYTLDSAMEDRGLRPVKGGKDSLFKVARGTWYGWPDFAAGGELDNPIIAEYPNSPPKPETNFDPGRLSQFAVSQFAGNTGLAVEGNKVVEFQLGSNNLEDLATAANGYQISQIKFGPDGNLYVLVSSGKISELWKIESTKHPLTLGTTSKHTLPISWSISLTVMTIGLIATYIVYKNRQETIM
jgi:glucose/arabinose dehydrogenase